MNVTLAAMPGVELAEVTERAGLLRRTDRKYALPVAALDALLVGLAGTGASVLRVDDRVEQEYHTVYLDTPTMELYRATALRRRRRGKVRLRTYGPDGATRLEVKTRAAGGVTVKHRFDPAELDAVDGCLAGAGLPAHARLGPAVTTRYRRTTLLVPDPGRPEAPARVTIDSELSWTLPDGRHAAAPAAIVVETKSPTPVATAADRLLWSGRYRPIGLSKFGLGLALLRPELPGHRFRPIIRQLGAH